MMMAGQRQEAEAVISLPMGQASTLKMERNFLSFTALVGCSIFGGVSSGCVCVNVWGHYHVVVAIAKKEKKLDPTLPESHRLFFWRPEP